MVSKHRVCVCLPIFLFVSDKNKEQNSILRCAQIVPIKQMSLIMVAQENTAILLVFISIPVVMAFSYIVKFKNLQTIA